MQRKVMISCAVTGSADTPGKNPAVPVTPEQIAASAIDAAKAGAAIVHIHVRDPKTDAAEHGRRALRRGGRPHPLERHRRGHQPDHRPGGRFSPDADDPMKPGPGTTLRTPRQRVQHVLDLRPEICSLDMGSMNMGAERVREHAADPRGDGDRHPRRRRDAGARGVRDRAPAARQAHDRDRPHQGARHVPDLPRHRLGPAGDARGDELHAQPAARGLRPGSRSAFRCTSSRWPRRRCCSAAMCASGWRTISIWSAASSRRAMPRWSPRRRRSSNCSACSVATPAEARQMLGLAQPRRAGAADRLTQRRSSNRVGFGHSSASLRACRSRC